VPATAAGLSWFLSHHTKPEENKNTRQTLAYNVAVYRRYHGFVASTVAGARSRRRSFLPLASLTARYATWASAPVTPRGRHRFF
jgi:hypothetical protein